MAYKMVYNPLTGKWDKVWVDEGSSSGSGSGSSGSGSGDSYGGSTNPKPNPETSITAPSDLSQAGTQSSKEYNELEYNILEGEATIVPNPSLKAKSTVRLQGLGNQLTGNYYVESVKHTFSANVGYEQSMTLSREGFGDSIKKG